MEERIWQKNYDPQVPASFTYPKIPLKELFKRNVMDYPEKPYLIINDLELNYSTVNMLVNGLANYLLHLGVVKGDRVALMMPNIPQYVIGFHACMKIGAILVPTNFQYTKHELEHTFKDSTPKVVVVMAAFSANVIDLHESGNYQFEKILTVQLPSMPMEVKPCAVAIDFNAAIQGLADFSEPTIEVLPEDLAILQYTGGTTGVSKGCCLSNANVLAMALLTTTCVSANCPLSDIKTLAAIPLYHIYGQNTNINVCLISGGTMVLIPNPSDPLTILEAIKKHKPTVWASVPAMIIGINNHPQTPDYDISSIKIIIGGSSPIALEAIRKFEELSGGTIIEGYGMSETSNVLTVNPLRKRKVGTVGIPMPDVDIRLVDIETGTQDVPLGEPGEVIAKGPQVMSGYWQNQAETDNTIRDGWLYTGDIAIMDEDGFISIVDRKKDMIICSGFNVYPRDIDEVLYAHPKVLETCCIGIPDEKRGEAPKADVVLKPGVTATAEELMAFCREKLTGYKVPKYIEFIDTLPRTQVGKPDRKALKEFDSNKTS
ncbi:MAG: long-chain-fatty-acid--CoA ligase [Methylocystaceae bacterium]